VLVGKDDAGACGILNTEFGAAVLAGDAADTAGKVLALQGGLDILHLEALEVEVIDTEKSDGILHGEAVHEGLNEVGALLEGVGILGG